MTTLDDIDRMVQDVSNDIDKRRVIMKKAAKKALNTRRENRQIRRIIKAELNRREEESMHIDNFKPKDV